MNTKQIYLDNAATTKVMDEVSEAAVHAMTEVYGNPSSLHRLGIDAERLISYSKKQIMAALGVTSEQGEIIFTSGATEGNNTAIFGITETYGKRRKRVVTTTVEHPSVEKAFDRLEEKGFEVVRVSPDEYGEITAESLVEAVDENTCLISAMLVNNENGYVLPIGEAFQKIKKRYPDCFTHCDCVQGFEKIPLSQKKLCADIITLSGHKIHAPKGIGAMFIKKGIRLTPLMVGGGQQKGIRSGTEPVPMIYAFGKAVEILSGNLTERYNHVAEINNYARKKLSEIGAVILSKELASPYILSLAVPNIKSETMLHFLEEKNIFVSSGSACSKGKTSDVPTEFKVSPEYLDSIIRLSFSFETSNDDIDALVEAVSNGMKNLAKIRK
ncbi:MAG: cysteine desulfurase [Oscillospiraceae bacterium]|nr:cysteine desulfurase [Oscillospiraceae bacterium]